MCWNPDGSRLATTSKDKFGRIIDPRSTEDDNEPELVSIHLVLLVSMLCYYEYRLSKEFCPTNFYSLEKTMCNINSFNPTWAGLF